MSSPGSFSFSNSNMFNHRASAQARDLETERQQVPLSIEEEFFIYDDIVISKDEARAKHWRLAGRKPALDLPTANQTHENGSKRNSDAKNVFSFNDFGVFVDEMDVMMDDKKGSNGLDNLDQTTGTVSGLTLGGSMSVTNTCCTKPNTAAAVEKKKRENGTKSGRTLKGFSYSTIVGHPTRVKCIALAPSEKDYASCSNEDASITINNLGLNAEVGIFTGHTDTIISASISPDGKYLATTSKDKTMILWDVVTTKQLLTFSHAKVVICCCFGPDSKYLVSGCQDRVCRLWDTKRGKEWLSYAHHEGIIIAVAYSPDGAYVCSASADKTLRVWSATTAKTRFTLTGHRGIILSCSYTSDGKHIVSNDEGLLRVWSAETGTCTLSLSPHEVMGAAAQATSKKGPKIGWTLSSAGPGAFTNYIVVAGNNRFVYLLNLTTGEVEAQVYCKASVYCLTVGTDGLAACGDHFGNIYTLQLK
ncbi:hypothetical protein AGDE_00164 [Angomonas deanei]|nr:hypothetical protein AGDE_00164 [Angomonas deanei]|eukprot:EPY43757.1 hypothetical protein AGDE_00164 [Angomonas deanei]